LPLILSLSKDAWHCCSNSPRFRRHDKEGLVCSVIMKMR